MQLLGDEGEPNVGGHTATLIIVFLLMAIALAVGDPRVETLWAGAVKMAERLTLLPGASLIPPITLLVIGTGSAWLVLRQPRP